MKKDNTKLVEIDKDYKRVRTVIGAEQTDDIIAKAKTRELALKSSRNSKSRDMGRKLLNRFRNAKQLCEHTNTL